jgi:predicted small secreted protein
MRSFLPIATLVVLIPLFLAGCHTMSGAGKDVSAAGHAVTKSADKHSY